MLYPLKSGKRPSFPKDSASSFASLLSLLPLGDPSLPRHLQLSSRFQLGRPSPAKRRPARTPMRPVLTLMGQIASSPCVPKPQTPLCLHSRHDTGSRSPPRHWQWRVQSCESEAEAGHLNDRLG